MDSNSHYEGNHDSNEIKNGFEIYPSALNIIWGKDARYWKLPQGKEPAELVQVSWLEVTGYCDKVEPNVTYDVKFQLKLTPDAFGWNDLPIYFMAKSGSGSLWKKLNLTKDGPTNSDGIYVVPNNLTVTVGQAGNDENKLYFGLYEVWSGKWKGGLVIQKVIITKSVEH
ncbi:protein PHLOEM PROTEIN 2-LIKE A9-like [Nicotiana tabacum]|uniref:protein PHLOEM PROTEIN 2-LIKE A9-like n=1 Tax=Nicotiana tabacum TaxID=4097 RepID=UPI003F4F34B5